jgi:serine/threonine protein phosphatase 1
MKPRTIAFGDIHGDARALKVLLEHIKPLPSDHTVILGDVLDRGLDSYGVIQTLIDLSSRTKLTLIIGNYEEKCLDGYAQEQPDLSAWLWLGG